MTTMSTGRRLAKRSIIGTKVCAPGPDGLWYSGVIQDIKTSQSVATSTVTSTDSKDDLIRCDDTINETKYIVRFDFKTQFTEIPTKSVSSDMTYMTDCNYNACNVTTNSNLYTNPIQTLRRNAMIKEFRESDLIGPGFRSINGIHLTAGQRVYVTHNGRETSGDVLCHDIIKDEVIIKITPIGNEKSIKLKKRLEEVRLLESRRSARLAYHDRHTDFARLADMGGGERRRTPFSIDVPLSTNQQSFAPQQNSRKRPLSYIQECNMSSQCDEEEEMSECNAAMILVTLSLSPKSPKNKVTWFGSSPRSSSASWSSGSSSPPLSDDGHNLPVGTPNIPATARIRTTSVSTSDEGIVVDYKDDTRKGRVSKTKFVCTYPRCKLSEYSKSKIERHIRTIHLSHKKPRRCERDDDFLDSDSHEEEFYYTEIEDDEDDCNTTISTSPPTLSHRDMARPPHEDPEYQRQIIEEFKRTNTQQVRQSNDKNNQNIGNRKQQLQNEFFTLPMVQQNYWHIQNDASSVANPHAAPTSHIYDTSSYYQQIPTAATSMEYSSIAPCPGEVSPQASAAYVQRNYVNPLPSSPEDNINSNSVLQQLSQQNVTIRAHRNAEVNNCNHQNEQQENNYQQLANVTITPNKANNARATNCQTNSTQIQKHQRIQQQSSTVITATKNIPKSHNTNITNIEHLQDQNLSVHKNLTSSPNRRTRGENKKCRKVYGMDRRDMWCTQCRWKKACSRFGD